MATDLLLQALADQRKQAESTNLWGQGGQVLGSVSQSYLQNQDPYSNPNDNLIASLIAGLGSGFAKGMGQRQVRQEVADFGNELRGVAKDYYTGGDLSGYATNPNENISSLVMPLTLSRAANQYERNQKLEDETTKNQLEFYGKQRQEFGIVPIMGDDGAGRPVLQGWQRDQPLLDERAAILAEQQKQKSLQEIEDFKQKENYKADIVNNPYGALPGGGVGTERKPKATLDKEDEYRKEMTNSAPYKDFQFASKAFESVLAAAKRNNKVTDLELGKSAVQAAEPGLAVIAGETRAVEGSRSIPQGIKMNIISALTGGSNLTEDQRKEIVQWSARRYAGHKGQYDSVKNFYGSRLSAIGSGPDALEILPNSYPDVGIDSKTGTSFIVVKDPSGKAIGRKPL